MVKRTLPLLLLIVAFAACAKTAETQMADGNTVAERPLSFAGLERTGRPNDALAAPEGYSNGKVEVVSPNYAVSAETLIEIAGEVLPAQPRTTLLATFQAERQLALEQRSALFGFRDSVWVQSVEQADGASLLIYSRSNVGYWDLGVNRSRIETWLAAVGQAVEARRP